MHWIWSVVIDLACVAGGILIGIKITLAYFKDIGRNG